MSSFAGDQVESKKLNFQAVIKSASAASRNPRGTQPAPIVRLPSRHPWASLGFLEAALAGDLITACKFSFPERNPTRKRNNGLPDLKQILQNVGRIVLLGLVAFGAVAEVPLVFPWHDS